jgi:hypothetical protein
MGMAYLVVTVVAAGMAAFSAVGKLRHDPKIVHVVHEIVGVPLNYFPHLAACEIAGAVGLVVGIWLPRVGMAAGIGLVVYFVGAIVSHLRVADWKGIGPAAFMLILSFTALVLRIVAILAQLPQLIPNP